MYRSGHALSAISRSRRQSGGKSTRYRSAIGALVLLTVVLGGAVRGSGLAHARAEQVQAPGLEAEFSGPTGITRDAAGMLYVVDRYNRRIRTLTPNGRVATLPTAGDCFGPDGGFSALCQPYNLDVDAQGNLAFASWPFVYRVDSRGRTTRWAGQGFNPGFPDAPTHEPEYVDGAPDVARFSLDLGWIATDVNGGLYLVDAGNRRLRYVAADGTVSTVAQLSLDLPGGVAVDADGNVYVIQGVDGGSLIDRITPDGAVTILAGSGESGFHDGPAATAQFFDPHGLTVDAAGTVYVADTGNHRIRAISPDGVVRTLAGTTRGFKDGPGATAQFDSPQGVVVAPDGTVYVADTGNNRIRSITGDGTVSTLAGDGKSGYVDSPGSESPAIVAWGENESGELGTHNKTSAGAPIASTAVGGAIVTALAAGDSYTLALDLAGQVWAWGSNYRGRLGDGSAVETSGAVRVRFPAGVRINSISTKTEHSLALDDTGTVWTWGDNHYGQQGSACAAESCPVPAVVGIPATIAAISAGAYHNLALDTEGRVWVWGAGGDSPLGNGPESDNPTPAPLAGLAGLTIAAIAAGGDHSLALDANGAVWAWGYAYAGQLGPACTELRCVTPVSVPVPAGVTLVAIAATGSSSVALDIAGGVWVWGSNHSGELGATCDAEFCAVPAMVALGNTTVSGVAAGDEFVLAIDSLGAMWAWGQNRGNQLGSACTALQCSSPVRLPGLQCAAPPLVAAGVSHALCQRL